MNIALITIMDDSNLGNRLQNYAVQEILKLKGHNVTILCFSFKYYSLFSKYGMYGVFHDFLLKTGIRSSNIY